MSRIRIFVSPMTGTTLHVDDFIAVVQAKSVKELQHVTRALLHGIESISPDGMSMSKLHKEGKWESKKEILGWIFDGVARTMQLPATKMHEIKATIKQAIRAQHIAFKELQRLNGKHCFARPFFKNASQRKAVEAARRQQMLK